MICCMNNSLGMESSVKAFGVLACSSSSSSGFEEEEEGTIPDGVNNARSVAETGCIKVASSSSFHNEESESVAFKRLAYGRSIALNDARG